MISNHRRSPIRLSASHARTAAVALFPLLAASALPGSAHAQLATLQDYLAAGYRLAQQTTVGGPFTGCTKDQQYTFADGSKFLCNNRRSAFEVNPRVQILESDDKTETVVLIAGVPYAGNLTQMHAGGVASASVGATADAPQLPGPASAGMGVGPIQSVQATESVKPIYSIKELHDQLVQQYRTLPMGTANETNQENTLPRLRQGSGS
jgi:hypothetical protein